MAVNKSADLLFNSMSIFGKRLNIAQPVPTNSKPSDCRPCLLLRKCTVNDPFRTHLFSSTRPADCCPSNKMETKSHPLHNTGLLPGTWKSSDSYYVLSGDTLAYFE